jgi:hypothetical protein
MSLVMNPIDVVYRHVFRSGSMPNLSSSAPPAVENLQLQEFVPRNARAAWLFLQLVSSPLGVTAKAQAERQML